MPRPFSRFHGTYILLLTFHLLTSYIFHLSIILNPSHDRHVHVKVQGCSPLRPLQLRPHRRQRQWPHRPGAPPQRDGLRDAPRGGRAARQRLREAPLLRAAHLCDARVGEAPGPAVVLRAGVRDGRAGEEAGHHGRVPRDRGGRRGERRRRRRERAPPVAAVAAQVPADHQRERDGRGPRPLLERRPRRDVPRGPPAGLQLAAAEARGGA